MSRKSKRHERLRRGSPPAHLCVERLDDRVLPSVTLTAVVPNGTDAIRGDRIAADHVETGHRAGVNRHVSHLDRAALIDAALSGFSAAAPTNRLQGLATDRCTAPVKQVGQVATKLLSTGLDRVNGQGSGSVIPTDPTTGIAPGLAGINVAVIDTGIDLGNPDLNVLGGVSFVTGNSTGQDDNGHGTGVASLVGAKADRAGVAASNQGITGVAPGVGVYAVKVLDRNGSGSISSIVGGIDWVAQHAAADHILFANMSLGGVGYSQSIHDAVARATAQGVTFLVAAGNESINAANTIPGGFNDTVITVSALADSDGQPGGLGAPTQYGPDDSLASFSNYGSVVDVAAPGVNVSMDRLGGGTWTASGTSMATPIATGTAALIVAADRRLRLTSVFDTQSLAARWTYIRSRLIATGTAPDTIVTTNFGQQVYAGGQPGISYTPVVTYVRIVYRRHVYVVPQVSYSAVSSRGRWKNDPDGIAEPLVNAANAYALG